jgi:F-type H+-transporting ATPase subunit epsilon
MALQCIVVTPERTVLDEQAEFVALTLFDGEIGVSPRHTPFIGRLGYGEMRITQLDKMERFYVEGGFVEVLDDVVTVLTGRAIPASQIDEAVAMEHLQASRAKPANTLELMKIRDRAVSQSRAELHTAQREKSN